MLKFLGSIGRIAFGFVLASVAAGFVTMLFVNTPSDVLAQPMNRLPRTAGETFELALLTATHLAIFSFIFALIVAALGELFSLRNLPFYLIGGVGIALLGFFAQYSSEVQGESTILNNYALKTFLTTGFFAGFVYWLASGQFAGRAPALARTGEDIAIPDPATEARVPDDDKQARVVIRKTTSAQATPRPKHQTLLNHLSFHARESTGSQSPASGSPPNSSDRDVER